MLDIKGNRIALNGSESTIYFDADRQTVDTFLLEYASVLRAELPTIKTVSYPFYYKGTLRYTVGNQGAHYSPHFPETIYDFLTGEKGDSTYISGFQKRDNPPTTSKYSFSARVRKDIVKQIFEPQQNLYYFYTNKKMSPEEYSVAVLQALEVLWRGFQTYYTLSQNMWPDPHVYVFLRYSIQRVITPLVENQPAKHITRPDFFWRNYLENKILEHIRKEMLQMPLRKRLTLMSDIALSDDNGTLFDKLLDFWKERFPPHETAMAEEYILYL